MSGLLEWRETSGVKVMRRTRLLMLLDAADYAVVSPLSVARLHAFAFLADVLSPLYGLPSMSGQILKRRIGPYFPDLQWEMDRLIGQGLIEVSNLHSVFEDGRTYLDASYALNRDACKDILEQVYKDDRNLRLRDFLRQLADALGTVPDNDLDAATRADVTWETGHSGTIIDYDEWHGSNLSKLSTDRLEGLVNGQVPTGLLEVSPGAKVNLYVQYLRQAAING